MTDAAAPDGRIPVRIEATGYFRLHVPPGLPERPAPAIVAIHGYGQPPEEMFEYAKSVARPGTVVVAPEGPSAWYRDERRPSEGGVGHGWIADPSREESEQRNDALIAAALRAAEERHPLDPARTVLLGYSQGVGVAVHFFCSDPGAAAALVGLAGGVTLLSRPRLFALEGKHVLWVTGARDRAYPPAYTAPLLEAWREAGVILDAVSHDVGHGILATALPAVRPWLALHLRGPR